MYLGFRKESVVLLFPLRRRGSNEAAAHDTDAYPRPNNDRTVLRTDGGIIESAASLAVRACKDRYRSEVMKCFRACPLLPSFSITSPTHALASPRTQSILSCGKSMRHAIFGERSHHDFQEIGRQRNRRGD